MYSSTLESRKAGKVESPVFTVKVRVAWCLQEDEIRLAKKELSLRTLVWYGPLDEYPWN